MSAIPRLLDMGIEPCLLSSTLTMVVAQRLVRRICTGCRDSVTIDEGTLQRLRARADWEHVVGALRDRGILGSATADIGAMRMYRGRGCSKCGGSGFRGRLGVFEILEITPEMRPLILARPDAASLPRLAATNGMRTMFEDGLAKVFLGESTVDELFRVAA